MSIKTKVLDAATFLDDFVEDLGLPEEDWKTRVDEEIDLPKLLEVMRKRMDELFNPLPEHALRVKFVDGTIARTRIKGANVKMAMKMCLMGIEQTGMEVEQIYPWDTSG